MATINGVQAKVRASATKYHFIWERLENLSRVVYQFNWQKVLKPLLDDDITSLTSMDDRVVQQGSEGRKKLSWIWRIHGTGQDVDEATHAGV